MIVLEDLEIEKKLEILSDAAKYDVACTSSGVERKGSQEGMGNATHCGICHSFAADGRCISLLKVLMTNECIYDCKYCINRRSNDTVRTSFTPQELCGLTIQFYRRNYIEGLFLSSGIRRSPDETMEQIYRVLFLLRRQYHFNGYIHVKGIPGASAELVQAVGKTARIAVIAARRPHRTVRPHAAAGRDFAIQNGAGIAQSIPAAPARGLVSDGKDLTVLEFQQVDAVGLFQGGGVGAGFVGALGTLGGFVADGGFAEKPGTVDGNAGA